MIQFAKELGIQIYMIKITIALSLLSFCSLLLASPSRVIYGKDDRQDLFEITDRVIIDQTESTATFSLRGLINPRPDGDYNVAPAPLGRSLNLCPGTRFADQPSIGACSATLISPKHLLTAGHCMPDQKRCEEIYLVFGFHVYAPGEYMKLAPAKDVYRCKTLLTRNQDSNLDFALMELDREVSDRRPVTLGISEKVTKGQKVRMIGYPDGIPSKVVSGATVRSSSHLKFVSNVDAFSGNSGSALFSETSGNMIGILFQGNPDYIYNNRLGCRELNVCKDSGCRGEDSSHISSIWPKIAPFLSAYGL